MPQTHFAFGRHGLTLGLPDGPRYHLLQSRSARPIADAGAAIEAALEAPVSGPSMRELAAGRRSAAISVCDITRPAPNRQTLPPILRRLGEAGIPREAVTICIATGLHRPATTDELCTILGPEIARTYPILNHDARDPSEHRSLGSTGRGTPVAIAKRFLDADLHLTLGLIEQHLMLGFSGGRKLVAPGLGAEATIKAIHSPRFMREPMATEGSIAENPLHAELLEIAAMARHDFLLDVTLTQDREISGVFAGEPTAAHAAGVDFLRRTSLEPLDRLADVVITSAAGFPLDLTFYQAVKGVTAAQHLVKPGGRILLLAACAEGAGSPEFSAKLRSFAGSRQTLDEIERTPVEVDQWQIEKLALAGLKNELFFYVPGVGRDGLGSLAERSYTSPGAAVAAVLDGLSEGAHIALVPEGPYVFARVRPTSA